MSIRTNLGIVLLWRLQNDITKPVLKYFMKTQILLFVSLLISATTFSQLKPIGELKATNQAHSTFGVKAGVASSGMRGDAVNNFQDLIEFANGMITTNDRNGFFGGGYVNIPITNVVSIEPALFYTQKGYEMKGSFNIKGVEFLGANAKATLKSQYVDLPIMIKANFNGLQLFAGPQLSYLMQADLKTTAGLLGFNLLNKTMDVANKFNKWDAAISAGAGYQFTNGMSISAAYDYGLSKVDANQNTESYTRALRVGLGFKF